MELLRPGSVQTSGCGRLSAEIHGALRTLLEQDLIFIPFDLDEAALAAGQRARPRARTSTP